MAKKSAGQLHAIVSADATSYINELKRADEATRARAASMGGQIDKLGQTLSREFTAAKMGKNLLSGIGIGSGAGIVMTGVDYFVGMWKEAAEYAKEVDDRAKDIAKSMQELRQLRFDKKVSSSDPAERMGLLNDEMARTAAARDKAEDERLKALRGFEFGNSAKGVGVMIRDFEGEDFAGGKDNPGMLVRKFTDEMLRRADAAQLKATELAKELEKLAGQATATTDELAAAGKKLREERDKADAYQLDLSVKDALFTHPDRRHLKEVTPDDHVRADDELRKYREELRAAGIKNATRYADRIDQASRVNVDDMTRRGMGTGANYSEIGKQTNDVLMRIERVLEAIRRERTLSDEFSN
jgi:hypothetical protein